MELTEDVKVMTTAMEAGLWGLVVKCMTEGEGQGAALALLENVRAGRGEVDVQVSLDKQGVRYVARYLSQGGASPLFTVNIGYPPAGGGAKGVH